jgi:transmembrane sensor
MDFCFSRSASSDEIDGAAASWAARIESDMTMAEEEELAAWLVEDSRHEPRLENYRKLWRRFEVLNAPAPGCVAAPGASRRRRPIVHLAQVILAAAASVAVTFWWARPFPTSDLPPPVASVDMPAPLEEQILDDGSKVLLNRGASILVQYSADERRVHLVAGEAHFDVARDPARPFIVAAEGVDVRAVGTAFNVCVAGESVDVVVTEGTVRVDSRAFPEHSASEISVATLTLLAGQSTSLRRTPVAMSPSIHTLSSADLEARLAWQPRWLDYGDAPLAEIVAEFNRRNAVNLIVANPAVAAMRLTATFRSDNVQGFIRLLESSLGITVERRKNGDLVLAARSQLRRERVRD